jgi:hypothetical protein
MFAADRTATFLLSKHLIPVFEVNAVEFTVTAINCRFVVALQATRSVITSICDSKFTQ